MPYRIRKAPGRDLYWVVGPDGKHMSKDPIPRERAEAQRRALYASETKQGGATHRENVLKRHDAEDRSYSLKELSEMSKVPLHILQEVYNRGVGAHKTSPKSVRLKGSFVKNVDAPMSAKLSKEQWGYARVYSFIDGNPKHDEDLRRNLEGAGFFGDVWDFGKKVVGRVRDITRGVRRDYPPKVRKVLSVVGNVPVVQMYVRRDPIRGPLHTVLNLLTLGKWREVKEKYFFDKVFHLGLEVVLQPDASSPVRIRYVLEKNEVINVSPANAMSEDTEIVDVPMSGTTTINQLLQGAQQIQNERFFLYDAFNNNCGHFIEAILRGAGLATPDILKFVQQPVEAAVANLPSYTGTLARAATDAAALANVALQGQGKVVGSFQEQLEAIGIKPEAYLREAKRRAKKAGLNYKTLRFATNGKHKLTITNETGSDRHFGRIGYGDHLIWTYLEATKKAPAGEASKRQTRFHKSHCKIKGDWRKDPYSPNNLALRVIW
jgi:hypothetical protein